MANRARIVNNLKKFANKSIEGANNALERMCVDIVTLTKGYAPNDGKGFLEASVRYRKEKNLDFRVEAGQEGPSKAYTRYQEFGGDGKKKVVKNYTKAGSGKGFVRRAGSEVTAKGLDYLISEQKKIQL